MHIPFDQLPEESRIWIYQSNRKLSDDEVTKISNELENFIMQWSAHGQPLEASHIVKYNRFIIIAVDDQKHAPTGCSIDASVVLIQKLEQDFQIELLDKMNVTYKTGEFIAFKSVADFKKMVKEKSVNENTIVFNNLVNTIAEWNDYWEVEAKDSWHNRFFK
jgi:hypothetical protein